MVLRRTELAPLQISSAQEIEVKGGRKAIVMWAATRADSSLKYRVADLLCDDAASSPSLN
jgi:hypothetical protein